MIITWGLQRKTLQKNIPSTGRNKALTRLQRIRKAPKAIAAGRFPEIMSITVGLKNSEARIFATDERPRPDAAISRLAQLKPAGQKEGIVPAGNASTLNDDAAVILTASAEKASALRLPLLATGKSFAGVDVDPAVIGTGPVPATRSALARADRNIDR